MRNTDRQPSSPPTRPYTRALVVASLGIGAFLFASITAPGIADADQVKYVGGHPSGKSSYCYLEAPHVHTYAPSNAKVLYRVYDDHHYFIGDPVAYRYKGPKHAYRGHHPVAVDVVLGDDDHDDGDHHEYCYLSGPHYHTYAPPPSPRFKLKGGVYWYIGPFPKRYHVERPQLARVNVVYKPLRYARPVVTVQPPFGFVEPVVEVHVPAVRAKHKRHAVVHGHVSAGVEVRVPSVHLDVHLPGAVVVGHGHKHRRYKHKRKYSKRKYYKKHKRYTYKGKYKKRRHRHKKRRH